MHVIELFDRGVGLNPEGIAFVGPSGTDPITYAAAADVSHRIAAALRRDGYGSGTSVAVLTANSTLAFPVVLGVLRSGATWLAVNATASAEDIAALMSAVDVRCLLHSSALAEAAAKIRTSVPSLEQLVCMDDTGHDTSALDGWMAPSGTRVPLPPLDPESTAALFGTGGTTGRPKAVEVPHRAFEAMALGLNAHMPETDPVHLVAAPMTHAAGALIFPVLSVGGTNVIHESVRPAEILDSIARNRVTRLFLPPTALYALLDDPALERADTSSLRYFIYGAAPISTHRLRQALDVFGPVMAQFYGQVETPMICCYLSPQDHLRAMTDTSADTLLTSCGRPSMVANVAVMDDSGAILEPGERGEIVVRSSLVMKGYHSEPEQTAATRRPGGWHATGDIGYFDPAGYLHLVDRKRDLIITGGFNVFPSEVEQVLSAHPHVRECAVIGLPHEKWGEEVTAVVELRPGQAPDPEALIALCKQRLGSVKAPKRVLFRTLPRSPAGKVLKRQLREEFWSHDVRQI